MKPEAAHPRTDRWLLGTVVALGAGLRLWALVRDGGARTAAMVYDDGVYVSAGALLADGRVPYRDFVFVQPPGLTFVAGLVSLAQPEPDHLLVAMRFVTVAVGVVNLVLVAAIVRRFVGTAEAVVSTLVYAVVPEVVHAEHTVLIEPWLNLACLAAVYLWLSVDVTADWRRFGPASRARCAGVLLALALTFKLWAVLCIAACVVAAPRRRRRARLGDLAAGGAATLALLWLPMFLLAPSDLVDQVLRFQLTRPSDGVESTWSRLARMAKPTEIVDGGWLRVAFVLAVVAAGVLVATRTTLRIGRLAVAWFGLTVATFLVAPAWWEQYTAHLAAPFAILAGLATHATLAGARGPSWGRVAVRLAGVALLAGVVVESLPYGADHSRVTVDAARDIERFVPSDGCVVALEPGWLVMAGRLPTVGTNQRHAVDPYAALILGHDLEAAIAACPFLVVSDFRLSMLPPELQRIVETEFVPRSDPTAGIRVLERR